MRFGDIPKAPIRVLLTTGATRENRQLETNTSVTHGGFEGRLVARGIRGRRKNDTRTTFVKEKWKLESKEAPSFQSCLLPNKTHFREKTTRRLESRLSTRSPKVSVHTHTLSSLHLLSIFPHPPKWVLTSTPFQGAPSPIALYSTRSYNIYSLPSSLLPNRISSDP